MGSFPSWEKIFVDVVVTFTDGVKSSLNSIRV
jgi:hypothetical protein